MKFSILTKNGIYSAIFGIVTLAILIVCNITWSIQGEELYKTGKPKLPPQSKLFQAISTEIPEPKEGTISSDLFNPFGGAVDEGGVSSVEESDKSFFESNPPRFVITGEKYEYKPIISNQNQAELSVEQAPEEFKIEDNGFVWLADSTQHGDHNIIIGAKDESGTIHTQEFNVHVSEYNYYLGTDIRGRSVAGLLIGGSRWILIPGLIAAFTAILLGLLFGAFSGYYPGRISNSIDFSVQILESIPGILLFFLAAVISGFDIYWIMFAVGLAYAPTNIKLIRSMVRRFVRNQFVEASKEIGFKEHVVLWRDIIWVNGKPTIASQICYCFAFAILTEVTLSYLGIGIQLSDGVSWGRLLIQGKSNFSAGNYWLLVFPGIVVSVSIMGVYLLGDGLGKMLDYRENS